MIVERRKEGPFADLYDLCRRVDLRKVNRRVLEALIRAGATDVFDSNRAKHLAGLGTLLKAAEQHGQMAETGQNDLFGLAMADEDDSDVPDLSAIAVEPWSDKERLAAEKQTLGLFLTGHPINQYEHELKQFINGTLATMLNDVERARNGISARVAGLVVDIRTRQNRQGKTMGFAMLDDRTGRLEIAAYSEIYEKYRDIFIRDAVLIAEGSLAVDDFLGTPRLTVEKLYSMDQARDAYARAICLNWQTASVSVDNAEILGQLAAALKPFRGGVCPLSLRYHSGKAKAWLQMGEEWRVHATDELLVRLKTLFGMNAVEVRYK
jgi:DNA polymerase-3 subunit alpha